MSTFFERNKKKGLLALLLLFLRQGKGVVGLLLMVLLLSLVFVLPGGMRIPWASRLAKALGLRDAAADGMRFADMAAALRAARDRRGGFAWDGLFGGRGYSGDGRSTVDYVEGRGLSPEELARQDYQSRIKGGSTVGGILTPDDAKKRDEGVPIDMGELANGLIRSADAGQFAGGSPAAMARAGLARGSALVADDAVMKSALSAAQAPGVGGTASLGKTKGGKMGAYARYAIGRSLSSGRLAASRSGSNYWKLAEARAYSVTAAPGHCDEGRCPKEYASSTAGVPFHGNQTGLDIMTNADINEPPTPNIPSAGDVQQLIDEANQYAEDARKCEEAEAKYGPQERDLMHQMELLSCKLGSPSSGTDTRLNTACAGVPSLGCSSGGCSASKAKACKAVGDQMRVLCQQLNQVFAAKAAACPLSNGTYGQSNCNQ